MTLVAPGQLSLAAYYRTADPREQVGGDWYDAVDCPAGAFLIVGDVQGHDSEAAELMRQLRAVARLAASRGDGPAAVLSDLDRHLARADSERIVTVLVLHLDLQTNTITTASAGHLPPILIRPGAGAVQVAIDPGPPLGIGASWPEARSAVETDAILFLYTDGLVEARGWPIDHGIKLLQNALSSLPCDITLDDAVNTALAIIPNGSRDDDVAVLAASTAR